MDLYSASRAVPRRDLVLVHETVATLGRTLCSYRCCYTAALRCMQDLKTKLILGGIVGVVFLWLTWDWWFGGDEE